MTRGICKLVLFFILGFCHESYGDPARVLVLYPKTDEPLHSLFKGTIKGIESTINPVEVSEIPNDNRNLLEELNRRKPDKIIALGKRIADNLQNSAYKDRTLAGWLFLNKEEQPGISLTLNSEFFSRQLSQTAPFINKVYVVQEATHQSIASPSINLSSKPTLIFREGQDMTTTIRLLGTLVETEAIPGEAVMIPANLPANILFEIAKIAWNRKVILLSTNLAHLENGALMVFYPDEFALGQQLGELAVQNRFSHENLQSAKTGVNLKVAQHLGITIEPPKLDLFSVKVP